MKRFFLFFVLINIVSAQPNLNLTKPAQLLQFTHGYTIWQSDFLEKSVFTGMGWGIYLPSSLSLSTLTDELNAWHSRNKPYVFSTSFVRLLNNDIPLPDSLRFQYIDGSYYDNPIGTKHFSILSQQWQQLLFDQITTAIDLGADGIQMDDIPVPLDCMLSWFGPACFDPVTMRGFQKYLASTYTSDILLSKFDIPDIQQFSLKQYILTKGIQSTWNSTPLHGIGSEFHRYMTIESSKLLDTLVTYAHSYAASKGQNFRFSCNTAFSPEAYYVLDKVDNLVDECFPFTDYHPFTFMDIKAMRGIANRPVVALPEPRIANLPTTTKNMIKLFFADIFAPGGSMLFGESLSEGIGSPIAVDLEVFARYSKFIDTHRDLYQNSFYHSKVAVLISMSSRNSFFEPIAANTRSDYNAAYTGTALLLSNLNIQFDVIFSPDERYSSLPQLTLQKLKEYSVVILSQTNLLTDIQAQVLLDYMNSGGIIIATGDIATNNVDGSIANRPIWQNLLQNDGTKIYGAGKLVYNHTSLGEEYVEDWGIPHDQVRESFSSMIMPYVKPEAICSGIAQVTRPGGGTVFLSNTQSGGIIAHIVNYDYDEYKDQFNIKTNFALNILADTIKKWQAVYFSPDFASETVLSLKNDAGYVTMTVPALEAYGIVLLEQNTTSPLITSRTPTGNETLHSKDSVLFSVECSDQDNNHLFYHWYINGIIDSINFSNTFLYHPTTNSGYDTIKVSISDGANTVSSIWVQNIIPYIPPKILFDESHNERNTILLSRAQTLNPSHPEWIYFGILKSKLDERYTTDRNSSSTITSSLLSNYHLLMISAPDSDFTSSEITSIATFVQNGGSLLFMGDAGSSSGINQLLQNFNISFENHLINSPGALGNIAISNFQVHPAVGSIKLFAANWAGSLIVTPPAQEVASSDSICWRDLDANNIQNNNEPSGPFTIAAVSVFGKGRVFCLSDNAVHDDYIKSAYVANATLVLNAINWLTENVNPKPVLGVEHQNNIPVEYVLSQNYPNPFNPTTTIEYQLPKNTYVSLKIYNMLGQEILSLVDGNQRAGYYNLRWDALNLATGVYIYRLMTRDFVQTKKMILLK
jgi:hypothetical protein